MEYGNWNIECEASACLNSKFKFMEYIKKFFKIHQYAIVLTIGYLLVACLSFGLGRFTAPKYLRQVTPLVGSKQSPPPPNYNPNEPAVQSASTTTKTVPGTPGGLNCAGKIKGSSSLIYHMPGGSFYNKTTHPIRCFDTEAQARAAGFRKSAK